MTLPTEQAVRPALLQVLADLDGQARPIDVYPVLTERFGLSPEDVTELYPDGRTPVWRNRIQWVRSYLVRKGLLDGSERGVWRLTAEGWEAAQGGLKDDPSVQLQEETSDELSQDSGALALAEIAQELREASLASSSPTRLEIACGQAFRFLGFDAEVLGGSGRTDVLITAPLGVNAFTVVLDAKSSSHKKVADAQIDWLSISSHKERLSADYACIVGPGFGAGHLQERATAFEMVLVSTEELIEILELHDQAPFALTELRDLFEAVPTAGGALPRLRMLSESRRRFQLLLERLLAVIDNFNRTQPDLVIAKPDTLLALTLASNDQALKGTTMSEVLTSLRLMEAAGILVELPGGGFASVTSMEGARRRLARLVPAWSS